MRYLLVDTANTFFRARHAAHRQSDTWDKLGFAIHVTLGSVNKAWRDQKADHVVFCLEGRSWRKDHYKPYTTTLMLFFLLLQMGQLLLILL